MTPSGLAVVPRFLTLSAWRRLVATACAALLAGCATTPVPAAPIPVQPIAVQRIELRAPIDSAEVVAALDALAGAPLDDALRARAQQLLGDFYAWLEWRNVDIAMAAAADDPAVLQITVRAEPPLPLDVAPDALADVDTPASADVPPADVTRADVALTGPAEPAGRPGARDEATLDPAAFEFWLQTKAVVLVDAAERRLYLRRGEHVVSYAVAVGTEVTPTPPGMYHVEQISHQPAWYPTPMIRRDHAARGIVLPRVVPPGRDNPLGNWFVRLQDSIGIHGTNQPGSIGQASSYGCVRMHDGDIRELAGTLRPGDFVLIVDQRPGQTVTLRGD